MFDYKTKCEELIKSNVVIGRENEQLRRDNEWLKKVLAQALERMSTALVVRDEELANAPKIELEENLANEIIIRVRRTR